MPPAAAASVSEAEASRHRLNLEKRSSLRDVAERVVLRRKTHNRRRLPGADQAQETAITLTGALSHQGGAPPSPPPNR